LSVAVSRLGLTNGSYLKVSKLHGTAEKLAHTGKIVLLESGLTLG
jgi:hypothetical protein